MIKHSSADRQQSVGYVKKELLARGNEFIALQRLDEAKRAVIPAFEPDDPLGGKDVRVKGVDYEPETLIITLDPPPNPKWIEALQNIGAFRRIVGGAEPRNVNFVNGKAVVMATPNLAEQVFDLFKEWLVSANQEYQARLRQAAEQRRAEEHRRLAREQQLADERAQVLTKLRQKSFS